MPKLLFNCFYCQKQVSRYACQMKRNVRNYCSVLCASKSNYKDKSCFQHPTPEERFFKNISALTHSKGCWIWNGLKNKAGYGRIRIKYRDKTTHRYSWEIHFGEIPDDKIICHHCDNPSCVNPAHLYLGTHTENANDMVARGRDRKQKGSLHNMSKLNEEQVLQIREYLFDGEKGAILARKYKISPMTISNIKKRKSWRHI